MCPIVSHTIFQWITQYHNNNEEDPLLIVRLHEGISDPDYQIKKHIILQALMVALHELVRYSQILTEKRKSREIVTDSD